MRMTQRIRKTYCLRVGDFFEFFARFRILVSVGVVLEGPSNQKKNRTVSPPHKYERKSIHLLVRRLELVIRGSWRSAEQVVKFALEIWSVK